MDLDSAECRNILPILQGECGFEAGKILLNGKEYSFQSVHQSIRDGIAFIEARPMEEMLFADMTVLDHMTFMIQRNKKKFFLRKKIQKDDPVPVRWNIQRRGIDEKNILGQ